MKNSTLLSIVLLLTTSSLKAQIDGPRNANISDNVTLSGSSQAWADTDNALKSDDNYTSFGNISGGISSYTQYLRVEKFDFNIPEGAIIKGIKVDIERSDPNQASSDYSIRIIKEGVISGTNKSTGLAFPLTDAYQTYGGPTDLWGETWGFKNINGANFGVAISSQRNTASGTTAGQIDDIQVTVYWGFVTLPVNLVSFTALKNNNKVNINWNTSSESNMDHFEVERSSDGNVFYSLTSVSSQNRSVASYSYIDENPVAGTSYYRLKMQELSGEKNYSKILPIQFPKYTTVRLSPSPWTRGTNLVISNPAKELLTIQFYDVAGQVIGKTSTTTTEVIMPVLTSTKGVIYYRVSGKNNQLKGNGSLLVN
ncbi:hypothetical protein CAP36_16000 [Chitinophagaceae bacterium IBVUCB2]|nr:hypothetical protein CAP36_16000 [Chitinophagaceae bacterium IBVUCB2]